MEKDYVSRRLTRNLENHEIIDQQLKLLKLERSINEAVTLVVDRYKKGGKVIVGGNGGSFADAQHFAAELVGRFEKNRPALPAYLLGSNQSTATAVANDYGYARVFARELNAFGNQGDVLFLYTTSGTSTNVLAAAEEAGKKGVIPLMITGSKAPRSKYVHHTIQIPSDNTARIQEVTALINHTIAGSVEDALFGKKAVLWTESWSHPIMSREHAYTIHERLKGTKELEHIQEGLTTLNIGGYVICLLKPPCVSVHPTVNAPNQDQRKILEDQGILIDFFVRNGDLESKTRAEWKEIGFNAAWREIGFNPFTSVIIGNTAEKRESFLETASRLQCNTVELGNTANLVRSRSRIRREDTGTGAQFYDLRAKDLAQAASLLEKIGA